MSDENGDAESNLMDIRIPWRKLLKAIVGLIISAVVSIQLYQIYTFLSGRTSDFQTFITGFSALGTLLLAYVTFRTVEQNEDLVDIQRNQVEQMQNQVKQMRIEKERQPAQRAVDRIIQPAINQLVDNISMLDSGNLGWEGRGVNQRHQISASTDIEPVYEPEELDVALVDWFQQWDQDLATELKEYNEYLISLENACESLSGALREPIRNQLKNEFGDRLIQEGIYDETPDVEEVTKMIINQERWETDEYHFPQPQYTFNGGSSMHPSILTDTQQKGVAEEIGELCDCIADLESASENLKQNLENSKRIIGQEYSIVSSVSNNSQGDE